MDRRKLSVRKTREIIRLRFELGLSIRQIAHSLSVSHSTVGDIVRKAQAANMGWPLPEEIDDVELDRRMYPRPAGRPVNRPTPDMETIHAELRKKGVTLELLWLEYKREHPDGYQYSQFCEHYRHWAKQLDVVLRHTHRAGEKMFVDFAGPTIPVIDPETGEARQAHVFVAVLGASNYTYVEPCWSGELRPWIEAHCNAFEYFKGVPAIVVPDNLGSGVTRACRYDPDINATYLEMATHYRTVIIPTRPRKPRDKAKAENGVQMVERHVMAPLRKRTFFGLAEARSAFLERLEELNARPFQKLEGSRRSLYETMDRPALKPLPSHRYEMGEWKKARVNIDYHVEVERNLYSTPYQLVHQEVDVRLTSRTVEILHKGHRVASHARQFGRGHCSTNPEHRPASHARHLEWTPSRIVNWAEETGAATAALVSHILKSKPHPEQGYRACLGVLRLGNRYGRERLEAAAKRAVGIGACSYRSVKSILENGLDRMPVEVPKEQAPMAPHEHLRGPGYYGRQFDA